jgi:hypothetical protein
VFPYPCGDLPNFDIYRASSVRRESLCRVALREQLGIALPFLEDGNLSRGVSRPEWDYGLSSR